MSFSSEIKSELSKSENIPSCCLCAQTYGLVLFAHFSKRDLSITTENRDVFFLYQSSMRNYLGVEPAASDSGSKKLTARVESELDKYKVFDKFGHSPDDATTRLNRANILNECCAGAFLRGVFLSCGTVVDPEIEYHLEFVVPYKRLCMDLMKFMDELDLKPKYIVRKGNHVIYFKDSESVEDILAVIGAQNAALYVMGVKIEKNVKNKINRKVNFEMSNLNKTIDAASSQVEAIRLVEKKIGLSSLPENLRNIALIRLERPEESLCELKKRLDEPISRSGLNHRLKKIVKIAEEIRKGEEKKNYED